MSSTGSASASNALTGATSSLLSSGTVGQVIQAAQQAGGSSSAAAKNAGTYDFTHMSKIQMRTLVNDLLKSGKMTVDESGPLVSMTVTGPFSSVDGVANPARDNAPMNFVSGLQDMISFDTSIGDTASVFYAQKTLSVLKRLQGAPVDPTAGDGQ